ncbi:MAG TPA: hypothetical protein VN914_13130, partial [Polyangia bacterium]|nr:hypothetical protein [Polyangia bacterium]
MAPVRVLLVLPVLLVLGCGGGGGASGFVESSSDPRQNVLVIDDGFDLTNPVFNGRVAAGYSIVCAHSARVPEQVVDTDGGSPEPIGDGGAPPAADGGADAGLTERKAGLLAALRMRDTSCHLEPGLEPKPDPLASIARYRERWNKTILSSRYASTTFTQAELDEIKKAQEGLGDARFHGTATAGLIAYKNPAVRLMMIEERLGSAEMVEQGFTCFQQQGIDENVA